MYVENWEPIHKPTMLTVGYNGVKYHAQNGGCAGNATYASESILCGHKRGRGRLRTMSRHLSRKRYAQAEAVFRFYEQSFASYGYSDLCDDSL